MALLLFNVRPVSGQNFDSSAPASSNKKLCAQMCSGLIGFLVSMAATSSEGAWVSIMAR